MKALGMKDAYRLYKKELTNTVGRNTFMQLVSGFNDFVRNKIIEGHHVSFPEKVGSMYIMGSPVHPKVDEWGKIRGLSVDWKATKEMWSRDPQKKEEKKVIYHFNEHTNGIRYRVRWSKKRMFIRNRDFYMFFFTRGNRKFVNRCIMSGKSYIVEEFKN